MKKITFVFAIALVLLSCKKERTCSCDVTTSGNVTSNAKSAGLSFTLSASQLGLPFPVNIPPIVIIASKDTTFVTPYNYGSTSKETYDKISTRSLKGSCPSSTEESINNASTQMVPGSHTVTSTNVGSRKSTCKIE